RGADLERPGELAGGVVRELVDDLFLESEQPLGRAVELGARLGRLDAAAGAVEELRAEPLLECAHLEADRRPGDAEPRGRPGERLPDGDMQLLCTGAKPAAASRRERSRLRELVESEQPAVEGARLVLTSGRRGKLDVVDACDRHLRGVYHRCDAGGVATARRD